MNILVVTPEAGNWKVPSPLATAVNCMTTAFTVILHYSPIFREIKHFPGF